MPLELDVDSTVGTVSVSAAVRFGDLAPVLDRQGYALRTLGSLPHIATAGAVATGTHGSGDGHGTIAAEVRRLELVTADGDVLEVGDDEESFPGFPVSLGALGIVVRVALAIVPTYDVTQRVFERLPWDDALGRLDAVMAAGWSVSMFTCWDREAVDQVWVKERVGDPRSADEVLSRAVPATAAQHPLPGDDPRACTEQLGVPGRWYERLPHFRLDHVPSRGEELQTEYLVPRADAPAALEAVRAVADVVRPGLLVSEIRSVAADQLWLSPAYGRDSIAIHFTWAQDDEAVAAAVDAVEAALDPFDPRPHWGKVFRTPQPPVAERYPRYDDARALVADLDPRGRFRNDFVDTYLPRE
jgi:xylitol oxidase